LGCALARPPAPLEQPQLARAQQAQHHGALRSGQ
jgi:hypothetical protein